jgi:molecular chaperone DnaK
MPGIDDVVRRVFAKEPTRSVNPDEVVALGAAVQAGIFEGSVKDLLLLDVTPASLGVETEDGAMICVIPRNTTIPTRKSDLFTTATADQTSVEIHVLQGEHELADANRTLGRLMLRDIARSSPGAAEIEVTFDIDPNGILAVEAKDLASGKAAKQTLLPDTGLHSASVVELRRTLPTIRRT